MRKKKRTGKIWMLLWIGVLTGSMGLQAYAAEAACLESQTTQAVRMMQEIQSKQTAETMQEIQSEQTAEIMQEIQSEQAVETMQEIQGTQTAQTVQEIQSEQAAETVQDTQTAQLASAMQQSIGNLVQPAEITQDINSVLTAQSGLAYLQTSQPASQTTCTVDKNGTVTYQAVFAAPIVCDNNILYLFELAPYEYEITAQTPIIDNMPLEQMTADGLQVEFTFPVNFRTAQTRLYSKFAIGIRSGGMVKMLTQPMYITNPEALAWNTLMRYPRSKKTTQGQDFINLFLDDSYGPEIGWIYKTIQVMNTGASETLTHPMSRAAARAEDTHRVKPKYYMLNASDAEGVEALVEKMEYYTANSKGGENWIIGNEVNVRTWNYMAWTDWENYIREYAQAFRVAYNAIMSTNANARVYVCIDQYWDKNLTPESAEYFEVIDGKDFLMQFDAAIKEGGDIPWGLAQHPYAAPLTYSKFWDMSGCKNGDIYAQQVESGQYITCQNLSVLTDFMQTPQMLAPDGSVRHIILSEVGYTNAQGTEVQAAALGASYVAARDNPFIDEIIYLLEYSEPKVDTRLSGISQELYQNMDGVNAKQYLEWAKSFIGITDWSEILR